MLRRFVATFAVLFVFAGLLLAGNYTGSLTKINDDGTKITVKIDDKDKEFNVASDAKFVTTVKGEKTNIEPGKAAKMLTKRLDKAGDKGIAVTVTTSGEGKDEKVTEVTIKGGKGKGKGKDKDK